MKDASLLVWLTQLGLSVAVPLAGFVLLAIWVQNTFSMGQWVVWVGVGLGIFSAVDGFIRSLKYLASQGKKKDDTSPPVSFNDHH